MSDFNLQSILPKVTEDFWMLIYVIKCYVIIFKMKNSNEPPAKRLKIKEEKKEEDKEEEKDMMMTKKRARIPMNLQPND